MGILQVLKSREDGFPHLSQRESLDGVEGSLIGEEKVDKAGRERSKTADLRCVCRRSSFFEHLHGHLGNNMFYALEDEKLFEWSAEKQFFFKATAL